MELVFACGALALAALLYVFWIAPEPLPAKSPAEREREYLEEKRETLYENLRDLHLEYRMGKLSDRDYEEMKRTYQGELAALLAQMESRGVHTQHPAAEKATPGPPSEARGAQGGRCPRCGKDNPVENRFCGACGASLLPAEETP